SERFLGDYVSDKRSNVVIATKYTYILYVHCYEYRTPTEEFMRSLDDVVRCVYVAINNTPSWGLARANAIAELRGWSFLTGKYTRESAAVLKPVSRGLSVIKHSNIEKNWKNLDEVTAI
ncbi:hypothetical protein RhiirA4_479370, partial [Rhizophagus irregularis]